MPHHAFPSYILLLLLCFTSLPLLAYYLIPILARPQSKDSITEGIKRVAEVERSKLWLSNTSKVWSTRPMVKPKEEKW